MAADDDSAKALRAIADALGTDVATVRTIAEARAAEDAEGLTTGAGETVMLLRLVRLWRALPDPASRRQALRYLEALAGQPIRAD